MSPFCSHDIAPTLRSSIFAQVSRLHTEEADGEPEGALLRGGAVLQRVHRGCPEEPGEDG